MWLSIGHELAAWYVFHGFHYLYYRMANFQYTRFIFTGQKTHTRTLSSVLYIDSASIQIDSWKCSTVLSFTLWNKLSRAIWDNTLSRAIWDNTLSRAKWDNTLNRAIWDNTLNRAIWDNTLSRAIWDNTLSRAIWDNTTHWPSYLVS